MSRPLGEKEVDRLERFLEVQANRIDAAPPSFVPPDSKPASRAIVGGFDEAWLYRAAVCALVLMAGLALVVGGRGETSRSKTNAETASTIAGQTESLLVWIRTSRSDELVDLTSRDDVVAVEWIGIRRDARPEEIEAAWAPFPEARRALESPENAAIQPDAYRVTVVEGSSETVQDAIGVLPGHVASLPFPRCATEPDSIVLDCDIKRTSEAHLPTPFLGAVLVMLSTLTYARLRRFAVAGVMLTVVYAPFAVFLWWFVRPLSAVLRDAAPVLEAIERQHSGALDGGTWHALSRQRFSRTTGDPHPVEGVDPSLVTQLESIPGVDQVDAFTSLFAVGIGPIFLFGLLCILTGLSHSRSRHERAVILLGISVPVVATAILLGLVGLGNISSIAAFLGDG